jgi:LmbE family N-acetylglucosaminyl deacetylase
MNFLGKKLLFITAHPDDESFLAAGTIVKNKAAGGESYIICATYGERGRSHVKEEVTAAQLKRIRKQEFRKVSAFLEVKRIWGLGLPDKDLKNHKKDFFEKCAAVGQTLHPDYIVSFGQDGISGHEDHIAAHSVAKKVARKLKIPLVQFALAPWFKDNFFTWLGGRKKHGAYARHEKFGVCNCKISVDPVKKMKALKMHASQMNKGNPFVGFPERAAKEWLNAEYFVI